MATFVQIKPEVLSAIKELYPSFLLDECHIMHNGQVQQRHVKEFTVDAEVKLGNAERGVRKRVLHVLIEFVQNIIKHSLESEKIEDVRIGKGLFLFWETDTHYKLLIGNNTETDAQEKISTSIEHINRLAEGDVKELYKKKMKESVISDKGGAGLGFIDVVKKTGEQLKYAFTGSEPTFFILSTQVAKV